jgi:pyridinium-3,5-bisthiocarboxylic acid mononucleotide nickel chelatase
MRIAILDPAAGISGDMLLGALLDAGAPTRWLEELPARLGFPTVQVGIRPVERGAVRAVKVEFTIPDGQLGAGGSHSGRRVGDLVALVERAPLSPWVRERAVRAFQLLGEAEARVHGTVPHQVHLHEVGAVDALLDLVGGIEGFEQLGIDAVYHLPVAIGTGWAKAEHGVLPVPAPATAVLLEGQEIAGAGPVEGEATTPTGAALLRVLSRGAPPARWRLTASGWGAGDRNPSGYPNALRLLLADAAVEAGIVEVIAVDLDDMSPEYVEPMRQAIFQAGAVECVAWPVQGKKGRTGLRVEVLAAPEHAARVIEALFRHSTTGGVRRTTMLRETLNRRELTVELTGGARVRIKVWDAPGGTRLKAEFDDVVVAADQLRQPAWEVAREAERRAATLIRHNQLNQERA